MTVVVAFTVPGKPLPKERPRVVHGHAYTPAATGVYEQMVATAATKAMRGRPIVTADVAVAMTFHRKDGIRCDLDNLVKACLDGMSRTIARRKVGPVLKDDSQVIRITAELHRYSAHDRTDVQVEFPTPVTEETP